MGKIYNLPELKHRIGIWRRTGKKIVFTNGCFDLLHRGHVEYLNQAKTFGDVLIIGLNSDRSVRQLKGDDRPFIAENDRAYILANLGMIDAVCVFDEETPFRIISQVQPDVLIKGGDYKIDEIVGRDIVEQRGGHVITIPMIQGHSTSKIIEKIRKSKPETQ